MGSGCFEFWQGFCWAFLVCLWFGLSWGGTLKLFHCFLFVCSFLCCFRGFLVFQIVLKKFSVLPEPTEIITREGFLAF